MTTRIIATAAPKGQHNLHSRACQRGVEVAASPWDPQGCTILYVLDGRLIMAVWGYGMMLACREIDGRDYVSHHPDLTADGRALLAAGGPGADALRAAVSPPCRDD